MRHCAMDRLLVSVIMVMVSACASSPEVKQASSAMTVALDEYEQNLTRFQALWIQEIQRTRADMGKAMVARGIKLRIEELSGPQGDFGALQQEFRASGLIALSEEIEATQDQTRRFVSRLMKLKLGKDQSAEERLGQFSEESVDQLRISADNLADEEAAAELRAKADTIENIWSADPMMRGYALAIIEWGAAKQEIPKNLKNLRNVVQALKATHTTVDAWIQTDVTVSGAQIAELVQRHEQVLGLASEGVSQ